MRSWIHGAAATTAVAMVAVACAKVPYTGRSQFNLIPNATMNSLGATTYQEMLGQVAVVEEGRDPAILDAVGERIAFAANQPDYAWEFALIDDPMINAWCLPGGYIGFYSGILPVLESEAGMAFVMGHEVGHAVARHGGERMSQELGISGALSILDMVLAGTGKVTDDQRAITLGALGMGAQLGIMLPYSRAHEKEADVLGMMFMAEAGYPPKQSLSVWERMAASSDGQAPPEFLSTHPSHETRIANQQEWLEEASKKYKRSRVKVAGAKDPIW